MCVRVTLRNQIESRCSRSTSTKATGRSYAQVVPIPWEYSLGEWLRDLQRLKTCSSKSSPVDDRLQPVSAAAAASLARRPEAVPTARQSGELSTHLERFHRAQPRVHASAAFVGSRRSPMPHCPHVLVAS
jgi:hypothetical protein